jgi:hypothetical protein
VVPTTHSHDIVQVIEGKGSETKGVEPKASDAFTPFSTDELEELRRYSQHVADIDDLKLAQRQTMTMNLGIGGAVVDGVDREQVAALVSAYRKLAILKDETGSFNKVRNILGRHAHEKSTEDAAVFQGWLKGLKDLRKELTGASRVMVYKLEKRNGEQEELAPSEIIEWLVNGVVSHSDPEARARWDELGGWKSGGLLMNVLVTIMDELQIFRAVRKVVDEVLVTDDLHARSALCS